MDIIFRADDLGLSKSVNEGIAETVYNGIINNVGIMINMPAADHGFKLLSKARISMGLHANISVGKPVSHVDDVPSLVEGDFFKNSQEYRKTPNDFVVLKEAVHEVECQLQLFINRYKTKPDYIDFHAVFNPNFIEATRIVANKYNIPFLDLSLESKPTRIGERTLHTVVNSSGNIRELISMLESLKQKELNLMIFHPGYIDSALLENSSLVEQRVHEVDLLTSMKLKQYIVNNDIVLVSMSELNNYSS